MPTAPPTLRARRKRATRQSLAEAAMARFAAVGFDAATASEIAAAAGVSRRTFFRYFPTKEAAFFAPQQQRLADFEAALDGAVDDRRAAIDLVQRAALAMAARYEQERDAVRREHAILLGSTNLHGHDAQLDARWELALRAPLLRAGIEPADASVVAGALLGVMRAVLRDWFAQGAAFALPDRGRAALARLAPMLDAVAGTPAATAEESA